MCLASADPRLGWIALSQILPARKNKNLELELQLPATGFFG